MALPLSILENAIDSLEVAIGFHLKGDRGTAQKHAVLNAFHAVELLLKERLYREHPLLIFLRPEGDIGDDSRTVGVDQACRRLKNVGVALSEDDLLVLDTSRKIRNRIQHLHFESDDSNTTAIAKMLRFAIRFATDHLEADLDELLDKDLLLLARETVQSYEERVRDAHAKLVGDELPAFCPECWERFVVISQGDDPNASCLFCMSSFDLEECPSCGEWVPPADFDAALTYGRAECSACLESDLERWNRTT